jgi:Flp pilus assembly pilin Flp
MGDPPYAIAILHDESGQDATEYVLLVVLIALSVTAGLVALSTGINAGFSDAASTLTQ